MIQTTILEREKTKKSRQQAAKIKPSLKRKKHVTDQRLKCKSDRKIQISRQLHTMEQKIKKLKNAKEYQGEVKNIKSNFKYFPSYAKKRSKLPFIIKILGC